MNEITTEEIFYLIGGISFLVWCLATFLFSRISVKHIQQEMAKEGIEPPVWDKGIGSIIVTYSFIMVFPKLNPTIVDFEAVRRHTRKKDKIMALFYTVSMLCSFITAFTVFFYMDPRTNIEVDPLMPLNVKVMYIQTTCLEKIGKSVRRLKPQGLELVRRQELSRYAAVQAGLGIALLVIPI
mgnify:FL=1